MAEEQSLLGLSVINDYEFVNGFYCLRLLLFTVRLLSKTFFEAGTTANMCQRYVHKVKAEHEIVTS